VPVAADQNKIQKGSIMGSLIYGLATTRRDVNEKDSGRTIALVGEHVHLLGQKKRWHKV